MSPVEESMYKPGQGIWVTSWSDPDRQVRPELAAMVRDHFARGESDAAIGVALNLQPETVRILRRALGLMRQQKKGARGWPAGKLRRYDTPIVERHTVVLRQEDVDRIARLRSREPDGEPAALSGLVHRALLVLEQRS